MLYGVCMTIGLFAGITLPRGTYFTGEAVFEQVFMVKK